MAGLPKKYARMGFARGWRAFKAAGRSASTSQVRASRRISRGGTVARKRKKGGRASRSSGMSTAKIAGYGVLYGILREPVSQLASNLPIVGDMGDEVAMGALAALGSEKGSGFVRDLSKVALAAEASAFGRSMSAGGLSLAGLNLGKSSTASTGTQYL